MPTTSHTMHPVPILNIDKDREAETAYEDIQVLPRSIRKAPYDSDLEFTPPSPPHVPLATTTHISVPSRTYTDSTLCFHLTCTATIEIAHPSSLQLEVADFPLLRGNGFHISATLSHPTPPTAAVSLDRLGRILAFAPMWHQLGLAPTLSIYPSSPPLPPTLHLTLSRTIPSSIETLLPTLLPCAFIPRVSMVFSFSGSGPGAGVRGLVDQALRGVWAGEVARVAPVLGKPGLLRRWESRRRDVDVLASVLAGFGGSGKGEKKVRAQLWGCVLRHVKTRETLRMARDSADEWEEEEEEEEDILELENGWEEDMFFDESEDDGGLSWSSDEEDEDGLLWDPDDGVEEECTLPEEAKSQDLLEEMESQDLLVDEVDSKDAFMADLTEEDLLWEAPTPGDDGIRSQSIGDQDRGLTRGVSEEMLI